MKKILIVEDDAITARIYKTCLEKEGYEVDVAGDGLTGFDRLIQFRPDGMLVDLMLPKMSGVEVIKKVRAIEAYRGMPIIAFTNAFVPAMVEQVKAAGASAVLDKATINGSILAASFREVLGSRE